LPFVIRRIAPYLVFRDFEQDSAQTPNKLSTLCAELVFRDVPGQSVQRRWRRRRQSACLRVVSLGPHAPRTHVVGIALAPARLAAPSPLFLAGRVLARLLAPPDAGVLLEPPSTDATGSFPRSPSSARCHPAAWHLSSASGSLPYPPLHRSPGGGAPEAALAHFYRAQPVHFSIALKAPRNRRTISRPFSAWMKRPAFCG
jgi:hypothetical protein